LYARRYELLHVVRTHQGGSDDSYKCVFQQEDAAGKVGVHLSKELMAIAGRSLKANITTLAPLVLPASEQALFAINFISRKV
jgi:3-ketoacyl-CoA synthase